MDFENPELLMLRGPGVQRAITPADVGMADRRSGKARQPWIWLSTFAAHCGRMPTGRSSAQKHKQFVSERLVAFTGISDDRFENIARIVTWCEGVLRVPDYNVVELEDLDVGCLEVCGKFGPDSRLVRNEQRLGARCGSSLAQVTERDWLPWKQISGEMGCDRTTAWRRWQLALTKIAARLNAQ